MVISGVSQRTALGAIIGAALLFRTAFFIGPGNPDEFGYFQHAHNIFSGAFDLRNEFSGAGRFLVYVPVGIFFRIFGIHNYAAALWPLLCSLTGIVLLYSIGKLLFDGRTALLSAALLAVFPLDALNSTEVLPDAIVHVCIALSVYLFLKAHRASSGKSSCVLYLLSGISAGAGYFARENAPLLFFLFVITFAVYKKLFKPGYLLLCAGCVVPPLAEGIYQYARTGDFLLHWRIAYEFNHNIKLPPDFLFYPRAVFSPFGCFGVFYYVFAAALLYLAFRRKLHTIAAPLIWFLSSFVYLEFGSVSLSEFVPIFKTERYLSVVTIPMILIAAYFLTALPAHTFVIPGYLRRMTGRLCVIIFLIALISMPVFYLFKEKAFIIIKNIYNLTQHVHSFEENIAVFDNLYRAVTVNLFFWICAGSAVSLFIINGGRCISRQVKLLVPVFSLVFLPSSIFSMTVRAAQHKASIDKYEEAYKFIRDAHCVSVYTMHWRWPIILSYYFHYRQGSHFLDRDGYLNYVNNRDKGSVLKYLQNADDVNRLKGSCVIIDKEFLPALEADNRFSDIVRRIPESWEEKKKFKDVTIYRVK